MTEHDKQDDAEPSSSIPEQQTNTANDLMDDDDIAALLEQTQQPPADQAAAADNDADTPVSTDQQAAIDDMLADVGQQAAPASEPSQEDDIAWPLPDFTEVKQEVKDPASNAFNMKPAWFSEEPVEQEPEIHFEPMTIEELEALRQSAYEEGFAEGKEEGHKQGLVSGHEEGLAQGILQGQQEGLSKGLNEGQQQIDELSANWSSLIGQLHQPNRQIDDEVEQQVLDLAMKLAAEIVQVELVTNPDVIIKTVKQAVEALPLQKQHIRIHLHPVDLAIIEQVFPADTREKKQWQLLADGSLTQGDCLIENDLSSVSVDMNEVIKQSLQSFIRQNGQNDETESTT
ncbi:flagellar assembly protein FliH [Agarivorans sp. MS3-6]|uniref:flagellar assembly protein FliH n=1 Tax=Agarivorans sp. TSD2052 TaxID=2937286 RepID=UPI00200D24AC|nr:flagellar assembly protein FliH [Agarivorans sp. TSD2052]UPW20010.1 flagellar assembly protein FliH [Agarivorans sp. TSD2052]